MIALWDALPVALQNPLLLVAMLCPCVGLAVVVLRGFSPWPLVRAMLWRFRWVNAMFVLLIAVSLGMGIGLFAQERGLRRGTAQAAEKFDLVIAAPGSDITLMMAAVYLQPANVPLLMGDLYNAVEAHPHVKLAAPLAFGDSYQGAPVVGTTDAFVRHLSDGEIQGRGFETVHEAIIGAQVPLEIGDQFTPAHGHGSAADTQAHDQPITVVGRIPATGSPWDRALMVPVESVWEVHGLANGHAPERMDQIGPPFDADFFPGTPAIIVQPKALWASYSLRAEFTNSDSMGFFPGAVLARLYAVLGDMRQAMSVLSTVSLALVAISVLIGLMILIRLFQRQLATLRALGAPVRFVFAVVWSYAVCLLALGALLAGVFGQIATTVLSHILTQRSDIVIQAPLGWTEAHMIAGFITLASFAALLPAWRTRHQSIVSALRS
ncbi:MAG: ABC transporter permease [Pelagimonas sp.]|jgi:putative ABC transport system permease protein|nr:ABC transporter permease [Pelagimonas sp.]